MTTLIKAENLDADLYGQIQYPDRGISLRNFGAVGDARGATTGAITTGTTAFTGAAFTAADVGKLIKIEGAGVAGAALLTTVSAYVSPTAVTLALAASTTVSGANYTVGTDDTAAIEAAFAHLDNSTSIMLASNGARSIYERGTPIHIALDPGHYIYNGVGLRNLAAGGRNITIKGPDSANAFISIFSDAYLFDFQVGNPAPNSFHASGFSCFGGKGLYFNRQTTAVPQAYQVFDRLRIMDFSEIAIGSLWGDSPAWTITNCIIETTRPNAKGLFLPPGLANPDFSNTTIIGCRYKVVLSDHAQNTQFISGLTLYSLPSDGHEADIWIQAVDGGTYALGGGTIISGNRMSSENREGKPVLLIAAPDGVGDYWTQNHSAVATTRAFRDWQLVRNVITGEGNSDATGATVAGPLVVSYTGDLGRFVIADNSMNTAFTYTLQMGATPVIGYAAAGVIGPNVYHSTGEPPLPCNINFGIWRDQTAEIPSKGTPLPGGAGYDVNYTLISVSGGDPVESAEMTLAGSVTRSAAITDGLGGTNAHTYTFTTDAATDYVGIPVAGVGFTARANMFVEFDVKTSTALPLAEIDIEIIMTISGGSRTVRRGIAPNADWQTIRIPVSANDSLTGLSARFYASPDAFSAGVTTNVDIGRPRIYRANRPVNFDHNFIGNHAWNGGRDRRVGPEASQNYSQWTDWTNSRLMAKFGTPSSETDGLLIPLMANTGVGVAFTPTLEGTTTPGVGTYTVNEGRYFQLGKLTVGFLRIVWTAHTGTGNGQITLGALPATRNNATSRGLFHPIFTTGFSVTAAQTLTGFITHNTNIVALQERGNAGDVALALPTAGTIYALFAYEAA